MTKNALKNQLDGNSDNSFTSLLAVNRRLLAVFLMLVQVTAANYLAFLLRFELYLPSRTLKIFLLYLPTLLLIRLLFFIAAGLHKSLWRYAGVNDLIKILSSATLGSLVFMVVVRYCMGDFSDPRTIYAIDWLLTILFFVRVIRATSSIS